MKACSGSLPAANLPAYPVVSPSAPPAGGGDPPGRPPPDRWAALGLRPPLLGYLPENPTVADVLVMALGTPFSEDPIVSILLSVEDDLVTLAFHMSREYELEGKDIVGGTTLTTLARRVYSAILLLKAAEKGSVATVEHELWEEHQKRKQVLREAVENEVAPTPVPYPRTSRGHRK
jgi:hypothetical protein